MGKGSRSDDRMLGGDNGLEGGLRRREQLTLCRPQERRRRRVTGCDFGVMASSGECIETGEKQFVADRLCDTCTSRVHMYSHVLRGDGDVRCT